MKTRLTTFLILLTLWLVPVLAQDTPSMVYGYCGEMSHNIGMYGRDVAYQGGMLIDEETTANYAGSLLTAVMVGTGTEAWKEAKINLSYDLAEAPFYQQDIEVATEQWNTIELKTPYVLEAGKKLYVYYTLKAGKNARERWCPLATDDGPANSKGDLWGYAATLEELKWMHLADENYGNICIKAVLQGVNLTRYDLTVDNIATRDFVKPGVPFSAEVSVRNVASETITSLDLTYQLGEAAPVTKTFTTKLENNRTAYFTLDGLVIPQDGDCPLTITVSKPNGAEDEFHDNDSRTVTVKCSSKLVSRKLLIEQFSTMKCVNCPAAHERLEEALGGDENIIYVAHHAGYDTDTYTLQQSTTYLSLYNSASTYAPAMMYDRTCLYDLGASDAGTPVTSVGSPALIRSLADARLAEPAVLSVEVEATVDTVANSIVVDVTGESLVDLSGARINVYLTEDNLENKQRGAADEMHYIHNHVLRHVLTTTWGNTFETHDGRFAEHFKTDLKDEWNLANMHVVAFVSHMNFSDPCDCQVYNATQCALDHLVDRIVTPSYNSEDAPAYNVMGQRIGSQHRGIMIKNGKKFVR